MPHVPTEQAFGEVDSLGKQVEELISEIQSLLRNGVEHARFEFKRQLSIRPENDKLDFIKLVQGVANAEVIGPRHIIVGADPREKRFFSVENYEEFDEATISSILTKYLDPVPTFTVYNNLETVNGERFIVVTLDAAQPRPILVKTEGQRSDGKVRLQIGDIWIKRNTGLQLATRSDIESMYRNRVEEEAEDRARKRFRHYSELAGGPPNLGPSSFYLPTRELFVEPEGKFRRFVEEMIHSENISSLRFLLELMRDSLLDGWDVHQARQAADGFSYRDQIEEVEQFYRDDFLPCLHSLVLLGLLLVKFEAPIEWLSQVSDVLLEAFEATRRLQLLKAIPQMENAEALKWWRPAFEIYLGFRCVATYATKRWRLSYLECLLPRLVRRVEIDDRLTPKTPMLFWPLPNNLFNQNELRDGRSPFYWTGRIKTAWGQYFGNYDGFLSAACELEFLLEFNSYLGTNSLGSADIARWIDLHEERTQYGYNPDLFSYSLQCTARMAEKCYDLIALDPVFPRQLAVSVPLFNTAFGNKKQEERLLLYGKFLSSLLEWQAQHNLSQHRFPFANSWQGRLGKLVERVRSSTE